jgi:hypothetical protein
MHTIQTWWQQQQQHTTKIMQHTHLLQASNHNLWLNRPCLLANTVLVHIAADRHGQCCKPDCVSTTSSYASNELLCLHNHLPSTPANSAADAIVPAAAVATALVYTSARAAAAESSLRFGACTLSPL